MDKSKGHIGFTSDNGAEYFEESGEIFRAPTCAVMDTRTGNRIGRWECSVSHFDRYRETFPELHSQ